MTLIRCTRYMIRALIARLLGLVATPAGVEMRSERINVPLCKDCKFWVRDQSTAVWDRCTKVELHETLWLVRGHEQTARGFCTDVRSKKNLCGPDGTWFEDRPEAQP